MAESRLHRELSEKALIWIGTKATQRGINGNVEVGLREGYVIDALALCRCYNSFEMELFCKTQGERIRWIDRYNSTGMKDKVDLVAYPDYIFAFETKVSRADFYNTFKNNKHGGDRMKPIGNFHFIVTPKGMLELDEVPLFWGLLEKSGGGLSLKKMPEFCHQYIGWIYEIGYKLLRCHKKYRRDFSSDYAYATKQTALNI